MKQSEIIKNISYNQTEILNNIGRLYLWTNQFDCDMTASTLNFYKDWIPLPKYLFDVCPTREDIVKIEPLWPLPLNDGQIHSIVIDLPFVIAPHKAPSLTTEQKEWSNIILKRFTTYNTARELYESYFHRLSEAYRVLDNNGICIFKCQSNISSGIKHNVEEYSFMCGEEVWFIMIDKFTLIAKNRIIWRMREQKHSRNYTSQFLVFQKRERKKNEIRYATLF